MYLIYPDWVFVVLDLCKIFMTCSFSLVPGKPWLTSKQQTIFFTHCKVPRFLFQVDCLFWNHKLKRSAMRKKHRLNGLYWMVDLQQVFVEKTKSNLQHQSSTTGFNCMMDHLRKENKHLHQEKIPPGKSLHKLYHQHNKTGKKPRTDQKPSNKKAPTQKIGGPGGSSAISKKNRGHVILPTQTVHSERKIPTKWPCNLHSLCAKPWFPPQNMANYIEFLRIQVKDLPGISLIIKNHNK